jgi:CHAT domain-containing protein
LKVFFLLGILTHGAGAQEPADEEISRQIKVLIEDGRRFVRATEFEQALERIEQALKRSRELDDRRLEAEATMAMSFALGEAGAQHRRVQWAEDALTIYEDLRLDDQEAHVLCELARAHEVVGNLQKAKELLNSAEVLFKKLGDSFGLARVDSHRSLMEVFQGNHGEAIRHGHRALAYLKALEQDPDIVRMTLRALSAVAYARHQQGDLEPALAAYDQLIELAWTVNDQQQINYGYCNRAEIRWLLGATRPAQDDLWRAIEGLEQARSRIPGTGDQKAEFLARQILAYDRLIRFLADTSRAKEAFEVAERFHARSLIELFDEETLHSLGLRAPDLWKQRLQLLDQLGQARLDLGKMRQQVAQRRKLDNLEGKLQEVETRLLWQRREPGEIPLRSPPPSLEQVQRGLKSGEALVTYWLSEDRVLAWVVLPDAFHFVQIPISRKKLTEEILDYLGPLRSPRRAEDNALKGSESAHLETGKRLYHWLIGSLPEEATSARRMILVADGVLHYLPFEALVSECGDPAPETREIHAPYRACNYLGLQKPLSYSPSAGTFLKLRKRHQQRPRSGQKLDLLAMAPAFESMTDLDLPAEELRNALQGLAPLAFAREEVERIAELFVRSNLRLDRQATESRLKKEAGTYRYLHLATHGLVSDDLPMSSGLLLGDGEGEDGLLQAHEVLDLKLSADLVTLSACRSGRGLLRGGEGIIGLSRSFLAAGASSVVVSLWDVDDRATPRLMETFYRQLAQGVSPPEAMLKARRMLFEESSEAKLVFKTRPLSYAHPRFWASFVVIGGI